MRIAIVSQNYPPLVNGQATFAHELALGLAAHDHDVLAICPAPALREVEEHSGRLSVHRLPGIPVTRASPQMAIAIRPADRLARLFREFEPEVVHVQDHFPLCHAALVEAHRLGVPVVATNHFMPRNFTAYAPLPGRVRSVAETLLWGTVRDAFRDASAVTTPTSTAAELLLRNEVVPSVLPISCGVDLERFHPGGRAGRLETLTAHGLPADACLVLYVGRLDPEKRVEVLVEAMALVREPRLHLLVAGRGIGAWRLRSLRDQLGLAGRVHFLGFVADGALPGLLDAADIFAMPSEAELQSISTLQALAVGLPVVAADAAALPELVRPGGNGLLFRPGDPADLARCLDELAAEPERRAAMGRASRAIAARHDRRRTVARYESLYRDVAQRGSTPHDATVAAGA